MLNSTQIAALHQLVTSGTLTQEQANAVWTALAQETISPDDPAAAAPAHFARPLRDRLIEASAYVGGAFVGVALFVLIAQSWGQLARGGQLALLLIVAAVAAGVGIGLVRTTSGGRVAVLAPDASPRRRVISTLLVGSSVAISAASTYPFFGTALSSDRRLIIGVVGLVTVVLADRYVTSALSEIGAFGWTVMLVFAISDKFKPKDIYVNTGPMNNVPPATTYDLIFPLLLCAVGLLWALGVSRMLKQQQLATVLGLGLSFIAGIGYLSGSGTRVEGLALMGALAAFGLWRYLRMSLWPWLVFAIATLTYFMFQLVGGSAQPVLGFLVAGLVLLAMSALGVRRRKRSADLT